jgi:hypothetical protein
MSNVCEELIMERARLTASKSVLVQALATLARQHPEHQPFAADAIRRADAAAVAVRREDLVTAHVPTRRA